MATFSLKNCSIACAIGEDVQLQASLFDMPVSLTMYIAPGSAGDVSLRRFFDSFEAVRTNLSRNAREGRYGGCVQGRHVRGWLGRSFIKNRRKS